MTQITGRTYRDRTDGLTPAQMVEEIKARHEFDSIWKAVYDDETGYKDIDWLLTRVAELEELFNVEEIENPTCNVIRCPECDGHPQQMIGGELFECDFCWVTGEIHEDGFMILYRPQQCPVKHD